jgi:hypothetical protein
MTREEWAISRTTVYAGMDNPKPASTGLSEYAGAEEIDAAIASLRQAYTDYGRLLKKHPDDNLQRRRRGINMIIKSMREENRVPHGVYLYHAFGADPLPAPLDAIVRRYLVAKQAADEAWERDVAATPVDDAAWEDELERRRQCSLLLDNFSGRATGLKAKGT